MAAKKHVVVKQFKDKVSGVIYSEDTDVSHFDEKRIEELVKSKFVELVEPKKD